MSIEETLCFDDLHRIEYDKCPTYIHRDHRWSLCILHHAQQKDWLPTPCDLILLDQHDDALMPNCIEEIRGLRAAGFGQVELLELCQRKLRPLDDDWVLAGIELGLIANCIMFGVHDRHAYHIPAETYVDHTGQTHTIKILSRVDGELAYQGHLSDMAYRDKYLPIWNILRWKYGQDDHVFHFEPSDNPVWVDIDLDVFAINWSDYTIPWTDEIFTSEFLRRSSYFSTNGWSPRDFLLGLLDQAGLFTIATEPRHCGGFHNMMQILDRFNHFVFDDSLSIPRLSTEER